MNRIRAIHQFPPISVSRVFRSGSIERNSPSMPQKIRIAVSRWA